MTTSALATLALAAGLASAAVTTTATAHILAFAVAHSAARSTRSVAIVIEFLFTFF